MSGSSSYAFGSLDGRNNSFKYPSAWWDAAHMELPTTVKHLFKWCRYHAVANPLISSTTRKMASYPITRLIIEDEPMEGFGKNKERWEDLLFRVLNIQRFMFEGGLDYHTYGNCIVSLLYPFHKYLGCRSCGFRERIKRLKYQQEWTFRNFSYELNCPKCGTTAPAEVKDEWYLSYRGIKIIRWDPSSISIEFNPITQASEYAYTIPERIRAKIVNKHKPYLEEMPHTFIRAARHRRPVQLVAGNVFHFRAPTPSVSGNDSGWGYPPILPALKDSFYLQVLKKANEAIMLEHLVPLDILFPSTADAHANPYLHVNLSDWKRRIETELVKWRMDPNHKPILPLPVGYQRVGGTGRSLMPVQEIRAWSEHIVVGMGVPQEFAFGGLTWSGSSVSMRMLENHFLMYRDMLHHFIQHFLIPSVSRFMNWQPVSARMKSFKMADDMQMKQLLLSLNQMKKLSDKSLLADFDKDSLEELRLIEQEQRRAHDVQRQDQLAQAEAQGESQQVATKFQIRAEEMMRKHQESLQREQTQVMGSQPPAPGQDPALAAGQPQAPGRPPAQQHVSNVNVIELADAWAKRLLGLEQHEQSRVLQDMARQSPSLHKLILQKMSEVRAATQEPLPEQRPPRRQNAVI